MQPAALTCAANFVKDFVRVESDFICVVPNASGFTKSGSGSSATCDANTPVLYFGTAVPLVRIQPAAQLAGLTL
jgi:hypothetical protein